MDIAAALLWPLSLVPALSLPVLVLDVLMLAMSPADLLLLLALPFLAFLGPLALVVVHLGVRALQRARGSLPPPRHLKSIV